MIISIWTNYYEELSLDEALIKIANGGFKCVELANLDYFCKLVDPSSELKKLKEKANTLGLKLHQVHGYWGEYLAPGSKQWNTKIEYFKKEIFCANKLGIKIIVAHPMQTKNINEQSTYKESLEQNVLFFEKLAPILQKTGVLVGIENMAYDYGNWSNAEELNELVDAIDSPNVGITLDTSHLNMSRINFPKFIHSVGKRLIATHISDNIQDIDRHLMPMFGSVKRGWIDWISVCKALREIDYKGTFNLETPGEVYASVKIRDMKLKYIYNALEWFLNQEKL